VWIDGERVRDVTEHPAFRNSARSVARLYDALHDPGTRELMTAEDRHRIRTHRFFMPSYSPADLLASREAIAHWSRLSYGYMGRTPDYKASFMATLGADPGQGIAEVPLRLGVGHRPRMEREDLHDRAAMRPAAMQVENDVGLSVVLEVDDSNRRASGDCRVRRAQICAELRGDRLVVEDRPATTILITS